MCKGAAIVLNYKNYKLSYNATQHILEQEANIQVVIVDNNSNNESYKYLSDIYSENKRVFVIKSDYNGGYSYGNNLGINFISSINKNLDYICIINPDVVLFNKYTIKNLYNKMKENNLQGITCVQKTNNEIVFRGLAGKVPNLKMLLTNNLGILRLVTKSIYYDKFNMISNNVAHIEVMPGSFFMMDFNAFKKLGYFDQDVFLYYEENILAFKAKQRKYKFGISMEDVYIHNHIQKDKLLLNLSNRINEKKISYKSQMHYADSYLRLNAFQKLLLTISQYINLYVEIPVKYLLRRFFL